MTRPSIDGGGVGLRPELHYPLPGNPQQPRLREPGVRAQWAAVQRFAARCTDADDRVVWPHAGPPTLKLTLGHPFGDAAALAPALARAQAQFGAVSPDVNPWRPGQVEYEWPLAPERIGESVEFVADGEPWACHRFPPVSVTLTAMFRWRDPRTGALLPGQRPVTPVVGSEIPSYLVVSLGPEGWAGGRLAFPFERADEEFAAFLAALVPELPFAVSPRHLRAARPNKDGTRYLPPRRLPAEDAARVKAALAPARPRGRGRKPST